MIVVLVGDIDRTTQFHGSVAIGKGNALNTEQGSPRHHPQQLDRASVCRDGAGKLARAFMAQGTSLATDDGKSILLEAPRPVTVAAIFGDGKLSLAGEGLAGLRVRAPGVKPQGVTLNGQPLPADAGIELAP